MPCPGIKPGTRGEEPTSDVLINGKTFFDELG